MKINPHGSKPQPPVSKSDEFLIRNGQTAPVTNEPVSESRASAETNLKTLTLQFLVKTLKSDTGVRENIVNQALAKVESGAYLTSDSAVATAKEIIGL